MGSKEKNICSVSLLKDERGATMVEFAFSGSLFLALMFCTLMAAIFCFRTLTLQFVAANTVRQAKLGGFTVAAVENLAIARGQTFGLQLRANEILVCSANEFRPRTEQCCPDNLFSNGVCRNNIETVGNPGTFLLVSIRTPSPFWFFRDISATPNRGSPNQLRLTGIQRGFMFIVGQAAGKIEYPT